MRSFMQKANRRAGFTILEVLLVVAMIGILAGIVILAINPTKQLGDTRNTQRKADINTLLNAVYQYAIDNNGSLPLSIASTTCATTATSEICRTGVSTTTCGSSYVPLLELTSSSKYLVAIPIDPQSTSTGNNGAGYRVAKDGSTSRVTVCAPLAEQGQTISATR